MIYLDEAATTKPSLTALTTFREISERNWMNPSSMLYSSAAANTLNMARGIIANRLGCEPEQIIFTSGSTEAANWIIGQHWDAVITSPTEHPCVFESAMRQSCGVHFVDVDSDGAIKIESLRYLLDAYHFHNKVLVAIMGANNETGTIHSVADVVAEYDNAYYFADNTQLWAHSLPSIDGLDYACASAHKFGGFKGTGFVYAKDPATLSPLLYGGHQEFGLRAGTENVGGIYAMAAAFDDNCRLGFDYAPEIRSQIERLATESGMRINGGQNVLPNIVSITMPDCDAQMMIAALTMDEIYLSAGSACSSGSKEPSRILKSMGFSDDEAHRTLRMSFGRRIRKDDIEHVFEKINSYREVLHD